MGRICCCGMVLLGTIEFKDYWGRQIPPLPTGLSKQIFSIDSKETYVAFWKLTISVWLSLVKYNRKQELSSTLSSQTSTGCDYKVLFSLIEPIFTPFTTLIIVLINTCLKRGLQPAWLPLIACHIRDSWKSFTCVLEYEVRDCCRRLGDDRQMITVNGLDLC